MTGLDFDAIRRDHPIADVVGKSVALKAKGRELVGLCPFHNERTPSFYVVPDKEMAHCFGCGWHGDVIDFVAASQNVDTAAAVNILTGGAPSHMNPQERQARADMLAQRKREQARAREGYIAAARRRWETASHAPDDHPYILRKRIKPHMARVEGDAIILPVYDRNGDVQSVQTIAPDGGKMFHPGAPMEGGRLNIGINLGLSIICEGFATGVSIFEASPTRVCVAFSKEGVKAIARELHEAGLPVAIAADRKGSPEIIKLGMDLGIAVYVPPEPHDDFNDMAVAMGSEAVRLLFKSPPITASQDAPTLIETPPPANDDDQNDPINVWAKNEPPELPHGLLPPVIERFARIRALGIGGDPGGLAMSAIAVCCAALTDRIKVKCKRNENWKESARLWVMLIGDPSYKKSPIMNAAASKISRMDADLLRSYNEQFMQWKDAGESGEMPVPTRLRIEDTTMEAAQEVCAHSPDGILALQDELSGWFGGIEKYSGGKGGAKDRSFWLRAYGGGEYAVNRVSRKSILIDNLSISILGGIQPDAIRRVMADATDDGLIQRFIPVVLAPADVGTDDKLPDVTHEYEALVERLHHMVPPAGFMGDMPLTFDDGAQAIRARLEREHHDMVQSMERVNKKLASHFGKYDGLFPRLCVIWHCIENANEETVPEIITEATAKAVADFLHGYLLKHAMAFHNGILGLSEDQEVIEDIAGYILAHGVDLITMRTFQRGSTRMRKLTKFQVEPICQQLEAFGWVTEIRARGERFTATVNPRVHEIFGEKADKERARRERTMTLIRKMVNE